VSCDRSRNKKIFLPWLMSVGFAIQIPWHHQVLAMDNMLVTVRVSTFSSCSE
jgi:hypothetical protein